MKLDRETMKTLAAQSDAALWQTIRGIAGEKGFRLSEATPPAETMARLRAMLSGETTLSLGEAVKILSAYGKGGVNG